MKYNLYKYESGLIVQIEPNLLNSIIKEKLDLFEEEIIKEYLREQKDSIGISTLGNKIRQNSVIKSLEKADYSNKEILIRFTENRRSFDRVLIDKLHTFIGLNKYFIVLEKEFGIKSKLVDSSFIRIENIITRFKKYQSLFSFKEGFGNIYFIEICNFENYRVISNGDYSKIELL